MSLIIIPAGLQIRSSGGVPWATTAKIGTPNEYIISFLEFCQSVVRPRGCTRMVFLCLHSLRTLYSFLDWGKTKAYHLGWSSKWYRPFTQEDLGCVSVSCLFSALGIVDCQELSFWIHGAHECQSPWFLGPGHQGVSLVWTGIPTGFT